LLVYRATLINVFHRLTVAHFFAPWSEPCKNMSEAMADLAKENPNSKFIEACHMFFDTISKPCAG